jgi:hypothetical protein
MFSATHIIPTSALSIHFAKAENELAGKGDPYIRHGDARVQMRAYFVIASDVEVRIDL